VQALGASFNTIVLGVCPNNLATGTIGEIGIDVEHQVARAEPERLSRGMGRLGALVRAAFLLEGVDAAATSGRLSAAHTETDVEFTLSSFERALARLKQWQGW